MITVDNIEVPLVPCSCPAGILPSSSRSLMAADTSSALVLTEASNIGT